MRYKDPETGALRTEPVPDHVHDSVDGRAHYAAQLLRKLQRRREDIAAGAAPHTSADMLLSTAVDKYFDEWGALKSAGTVRVYRDACTAFLAWADGAGVRTVRQLSKGKLREFAAARARVEKRTALKGGKRGETHAVGRRSPSSVNRELRALSAVLMELRKADVIRLSSDEIGDGLERIKTKQRRRDFLRAEQIRQLLTACERHDAELLTAPRWVAGVGRPLTQRYKPIAPLVRCMLLTGLRVGEAIAITWRDVDAKKIHVRAEIAKTKEDRDVDLTVAPTALPARRGEAHERLFELTKHEVKAAARRLINEFDAPRWSPHALRRTTATYFTNAFNAWRSAKSLGHSVVIAERHYAGLVEVPAGCETLEQAMRLSNDNPE